MYLHRIVILITVLGFLASCVQTPNPVSTKSTIGNIEVEMWVSKRCVRQDEKMQLRAMVTNAGDRTEVIDLKDKPVLDILVDSNNLTSNGVRRWSDGKPLTLDLTRLELAPRTSKSIEMEWVVDKGIVGIVGIAAQFDYGERFGGVSPGVLVSVNTCSGPLGP